MKIFNLSFLRKDDIKSTSRVAQEAGATMIEFALAVSVFLFMLIAITDLGRVFATKVLLTRGAQEAVILASKLPALDLDTRTFNSPPTAAQVNLWNEFYLSRETVLQAARRLPSLMVGTTDQPFLGNRIQDNTGNSATRRPSGGLTYGTTLQDAVLLRPGDRFTYQDASGAFVTTEHPTICPGGCNISSCSDTIGSSTCSNLNSAEFAAGSYSNALDRHPLVVESRALVRTWLPFFNNIVVTGSAFAFRELPPTGNLTAPNPTLDAMDPAPTPINPPVTPVTPVTPVSPTPPLPPPPPLCPSITQSTCDAMDTVDMNFTLNLSTCSCDGEPLEFCPPDFASTCGDGFIANETPGFGGATCECLALPNTCVVESSDHAAGCPDPGFVASSRPNPAPVGGLICECSPLPDTCVTGPVSSASECSALGPEWTFQKSARPAPLSGSNCSCIRTG